eukprot:TRINITY_DN1397_c0_g1_i1.p1 TRINITY_DN1397_c0_g1~~TRINITY_DN1397_c0_g1_i1.p1  ORF type:complete len:509 (+),score=101.47 TRINITY_DN1397_c0_g1_i1:110-1636(+)
MDKNSDNSTGKENRKRKSLNDGNLCENCEHFGVQRKIPRINEEESISYQLLVEETYKQKGTIEILKEQMKSYQTDMKEFQKAMTGLQFELKFTKRDLDSSDKQNVQMKETISILKETTEKLEEQNIELKKQHLSFKEYLDNLTVGLDKEKLENFKTEIEEKCNKLAQNTGLGFNKQKGNNECFAEQIKEVNDKVSEMSDNLANVKDNAEQYVDDKFDAITSEIKVMQDSSNKTYDKIIDLRFGTSYVGFKKSLKQYKSLPIEDKISKEGRVLDKIVRKYTLVEITALGLDMLIWEMDKRSLKWKNKDGETAMHSTAATNSVHYLRVLLKRAPVEYRKITTEIGLNPLHIAAEYGNVKCIKLLLKDSPSGYREVVTSGEKDTPLMVAVVNDHLDCVRALLDGSRSKYREIACDGGFTPLFVAVQHNNLDCLTALLKDSRPEYREILTNGHNPLHKACADGFGKCVELLLEGARPNYETMESSDGETPFMIAQRCGHTGVSQKLGNDWDY